VEDLGDHGKSKRNRVVEKAGLYDVLVKNPYQNNEARL
jgi:hypothetical protein